MRYERVVSLILCFLQMIFRNSINLEMLRLTAVLPLSSKYYIIGKTIASSALAAT